MPKTNLIRAWEQVFFPYQWVLFLLQTIISQFKLHINISACQHHSRPVKFGLGVSFRQGCWDLHAAPGVTIHNVLGQPPGLYSATNIKNHCPRKWVSCLTTFAFSFLLLRKWKIIELNFSSFPLPKFFNIFFPLDPLMLIVLPVF